MKLKSYEGLSEFQRKFHEYCFEQEDSDCPIYAGFVKLCRENVSVPRSTVGGLYDATLADQAERDWPNARAAAKCLFEDYGGYLSGVVDLVVWGCDSGVSLLAIYDQALSCDIPHIWTTVRSVTLFDEKADSLKRAQEIAEVLFPMAQGKIRGEVCDWENSLGLGCLEDVLSEQVSSGYVTRVNVMTGALRDCRDATRLSASLRTALARRTMTNGVFYNEIFVAWAANGEETAVRERMHAFEEQWEEACAAGVPVRTVEGHGMSYRAFDSMTYKDAITQKAIRGGGPVVRKLFMLSLKERDDARRRSWIGLIRALANLRFDGQYFFEIYRHVKEISLKGGKSKSGEQRKAHCLVFAPESGVEAKAFIIKMGEWEGRETNRYENLNLASSWLRIFSKVTNSQEIQNLAKALTHIQKNASLKTEYRKLMGLVRLAAWNDTYNRLEDFSSEYPDGDSVRCEPYDLLLMFGASSGECKSDVLPESLNKKQRELVFSRKRQRVTRGGPGTGKTLTMLHHALMVHRRTHLPVLIVSKTNSLMGNNLRRLKASYFKIFQEKFLEDDAAFTPMTVNDLLCQLARGIHCGQKTSACCRERCKKCIAKHEKKDERAASAPNDCDSCCNFESAQYAVGLRDVDPDGVPVDRHEERMKVLSSACDLCNDEIRRQVKAGELNVPISDDFLMRGVALLRVWGAVMVDEAQLIDRDDLEIIYKLTEHFNPIREFYIFADEEQTLHANSLEKGTNGKLSVALPGPLFGRWRTLTGNHRVKSRNLLRVYRMVQERMSTKYDLSELAMEHPNTDELNADSAALAKVFGVERCSGMPTNNEIGDVVERIRQWSRSSTIAVVVDDEFVVRGWHDYGGVRHWIMTHRSAVRDERDREAERRLRRQFEEKTGRIHLTTIDCAQGRTFENVLFVVTRDAYHGNIEEFFTGLTRASSHLYVLDASASGWAFDLLKSFGVGAMLSDVRSNSW